MDKLLDNLLTIDGILQDVSCFVKIKMRVESLSDDDKNKQTLVSQTDLLIRVLEAFSR